MHYLTPADLIVVHEQLILTFGGMRGITEMGFGRLEAAAAAPQAHLFGADVYADLSGKAAALCFAIVREHPFTDGNKRVALVALNVLLARHGCELTATNDEAYATMLALARGDMSREDLIAWVEQHSAELRAES